MRNRRPSRPPGRAARAFEILHKLITGAAALAMLVKLLRG
jgi:hypothetical protein